MTLFDIRVTTTVNWLGAPRCLRQMKRCSSRKKQGALERPKQGDYVSDRMRPWFESKLA